MSMDIVKEAEAAVEKTLVAQLVEHLEALPAAVERRVAAAEKKAHQGVLDVVARYDEKFDAAAAALDDKVRAVVTSLVGRGIDLSRLKSAIDGLAPVPADPGNPPSTPSDPAPENGEGQAVVVERA